MSHHLHFIKAMRCDAVEQPKVAPRSVFQCSHDASTYHLITTHQETQLQGCL